VTPASTTLLLLLLLLLLGWLAAVAAATKEALDGGAHVHQAAQVSAHRAHLPLLPLLLLLLAGTAPGPCCWHAIHTARDLPSASKLSSHRRAEQGPASSGVSSA
jgi:hypothetical protein